MTQRNHWKTTSVLCGITVSKVGLQVNVQLEDFLSYPFDNKNTIEHKKNYTGTQNLMFLYDLIENYCPKDTRLEVKYLSESLKFKDREPSVEEMEGEELEDFIRLGREVIQQERQECCFDKKISNSPLVQVYMSKQSDKDTQKVIEKQYHSRSFIKSSS